MFGYLRPVKDELKVREYELYKSVYCGLCRHLGKDYGIISRFTLSYDCTMLAMLAISLKNEECTVRKHRCTLNPMKKCLFCDSSSDSFKLAGAVSVVMTYYKLYDTIQDSGFFKRMLARFLKLLFKRGYKKAAGEYPDIAENARLMMESQREAEESDSGIDRSAAPTAEMLSALCRKLSENDENKKLLSHFGYHLGRWIYLTDAADDLEKDIKSGSFNPVKKNMKDNKDEMMLYCNDVLNMTAAQIVLSYDLMNIGAYKEILDNVIYHGLSFQQKYCLFEKKHSKKCRKKDRDFYPYLSGSSKNENLQIPETEN